MTRHTLDRTVFGPWSLARSRAFWEEFAPAALPADPAVRDRLRTVFRVEADWSRAEAVVTQRGAVAHLQVSRPGDLTAAADQVARFLALDVDATGWPDVGRRDPVVCGVQQALPGPWPCGFHSPYEAAAWAVLSQRVPMRQAARLRAEVIGQHGEDGAFPAPARLRALDLDLPGRKAEYLHAVAEAAVDGVLDGLTLQALKPAEAMAGVQQVKGWGRSPPSSSSCAGPTPRTPSRATRPGWPTRWPTSTAPRPPSTPPRRRGRPSAPGRRSPCGCCASSEDADEFQARGRSCAS